MSEEREPAKALQMVELHFAGAAPDLDAVPERLRELLRVEPEAIEVDETDRSLLLYHRSHPVDSQGRMPAQTAILSAEGASNPERYAAELQQSWACPDAETRLKASTHTCLLTEMLSAVLPTAVRLELFHAALQSLVEITSPIALVFKHSQQVLDPAVYLAACAEPPARRPGVVNVRFFRVENADGTLIMDTRGLEEIGLHDLQCRFRGLEPDAVSRVLFSTAIYIVENGPVIESGHSIQGLTEDSRWRCQFEEALLDPPRTLLDLHPGDEHAAASQST
ncbi:MAG: DUF4261 domain-containing protein [Acidobacteriota bacterium]